MAKSAEEYVSLNMSIYEIEIAEECVLIMNLIACTQGHCIFTDLRTKTDNFNFKRDL
jgi:hypothetical protein